MSNLIDLDICSASSRRIKYGKTIGNKAWLSALFKKLDGVY